MAKPSDDESSSDSSSDEFLVPADQLDLNSSFFQEQPKKPQQQQQKKQPNPKAKQKGAKKTATVERLESSSDDDDEYDYANDDNQVSSAELLTQVLRNLENAKNQSLLAAADVKSEPGTSAAQQQQQPAKDDLSKEISDLLMLGESQASSSKLEEEVKIKQEDSKEDVKKDYAIPEKGVQIHLPGESLVFDKKKKKQQDLQRMLQNKINLRIRRTQMFTHKVGLLGWLAYGFRLNGLANDADLLGVTVSLMSPQNYPKGRPDLKYLEKFTRWFGGLFKMCEEHKEVVFSKDLLMQRVLDKKIYNYVELILLYVACVRGLGINCRLVVSLQPPRLKPKQDQLFKIPAIKEDEVKKIKEEDDDDDEEMVDVTEESVGKAPAKKTKKTVKEEDGKSGKKETSKKPPAKRAKTTASKKKLNAKEKSVSPTKVIPENSREAAKAASEEAKKKAAAVLKGKAISSLKNCKVVLEKSKSNHSAQKSKQPTQSKNSDQSGNDNEQKMSSSKTASKTDGKKNLKKTSNNEISDDEEEVKKVSMKETASNRNSRSRRMVHTKNLTKTSDTDDSDDEEEDEIVNKKESKSNASNKSSRRNISKKTLGKTKDDSDDDSDKNNEKSMSIAKKLSLRVRKKVDVNKGNDLSNKKSTRGKSKVENKSGRKRKYSSSEKLSDFEEEVDSSSEFSLEEEKQSSESEFSSDSEYEEAKPKRRKSSVPVKNKASTSKQKNLNKSIVKKFAYKSKNPRKLISSDDESAEPEKKGYNVWVEVYVEDEESWISVNVLDQKIHCVSELFKKANQPVLYVIAWNSAGTLKDVTRRYCPHWLTDTRKKRVEEKWWKETLSNWKEKCSPMSRAEDEQLLQRELEQPLPKTVSECKGHPLYVLQRHLLKFEALYPPDVVPLGHLKTGEAIYSRHCLHTLYSRETWVKRARVVKPAQEAYKIVKSMPKYDKLSGQKIKDQPLELFGKWQTTPYVPPEAKDGKVPRNEYGNVDLFKMCMLPKGCVYIDLPALNRVARKLNIDCAPACVGFNFGCRGALPAFQGFVVCEEYEDTVREAWEEEQVIAQKRATEKREKRIYGNWKKLIKGLLIREKLAAKYSFGEEEEKAEDQEEKDEEVEEKASTKNKKPAAKRAAASSSTRGKRSQSKQESEVPKKKIKKS